MAVRFKATKAELSLIAQIADRAVSIGNRFKQKVDRVSMMMDLDAAHSNGCPLQLKELLQADAGNFAHDVFGIARHIDRKTGHLGGCFLPRFAQLDQVEA